MLCDVTVLILCVVIVVVLSRLCDGYLCICFCCGAEGEVSGDEVNKQAV